MKSQSSNLLSTVAGICKDIQRAYPAMKGLSRDLERLSRLVLERGLGVFTLDLPRLDSLLIQGLESGRLCAKGSKTFSKQYAVPILFSGLYMRIFNRDMRLRDDADVNAIAFLRQILCLGKKIEIPCSHRRTSDAIKDYIHVEQNLPLPSLSWGQDILDCHDGRNSPNLCDNLADDLPLYSELNAGSNAGIKLLLQRCQRFADFVSDQLGTYCPDCFIAERTKDRQRLGLRHGPGAVAEKSGRFFDKFLFTSWSPKLSVLYPWETMGKMPNDQRAKPVSHEVPSRLICVPKTAKGPRIIAAEPSEHMFCQNLMADWLTDRINDTFMRHFINLKDQTLSQAMVTKASLDRKLSTIDLSSASDRLSLYILERVFRRNPSILKGIHASRTRWLRLPNGECIELKKFASQGTALTFPIQTIVFWIIAMAACHDGSPFPKFVRKMSGLVRVYGDDIIVPTARYAETVELLSACFLKVNVEKSFSNGYFRESCGMDAFKGYDVTPIKPKTTVSGNPAACQAVLDTVNNLFYKGYWNASEQLKQRQPPRTFKYGVVGRTAGATGYGSFSFGTYIDQWLKRYLNFFEDIKRRTGRSENDAQYDEPVVTKSVRQDMVPRHLFRELRLHLEPLGVKVRYSRGLCVPEVRQPSIRGTTSEQPYSCGYSGLLRRQLCPSNPEALSATGFVGVPERPRHRKVTRWEAITALC
nr:MAG: hypothetical protein 3 [Leviviridae sp.]